MKEKVTVIVPVKDREHLLPRCLDSVKAQTYRPVQLIVVDNGSADGSLLTARKWATDNAETDFSVSVLEEPSPGACAARNRGLREADGDFTLFFDSDDTMRPTLLEKAVKAARDGYREILDYKGNVSNDGRIDIVCWRCALHLLDGSVRLSPFDPVHVMECHLVHALLRTHGYMARTDYFRRAGGWDTELPCWNDWELGVRIITLNPLTVGIPEVLADIYSQPESITGESFSKKAGSWEKAIAGVKKTLVASAIPLKRRFLRIVTYREVILAATYAAEGRDDLAKPLLASALSEDYTPSRGDVGPYLTRLQKLMLRLAYHYTKAGGRGAWRLLTHFL